MSLYKKLLHNLSSVIVFIIFVIGFAFMLTIHKEWNDAVNKYIPLKAQIITLRYNITEAHIWLEELIGGDKHIDINKDVLSRFEHKSFHNLQSIKNILVDEKNKDILSSLREVDKEADILLILAKARWENSKKFGIGSDADQEFDDHFNHFLDLSDISIQIIDKQFKQELQERDVHFKVILGIFLAINIFMFVLLYSIRKSEKNAEKELAQSEQRFKALHEARSGGIVIHEKGVILECNHRLTEIFGYSYEELIGYNGLLLMSDDSRDMVIRNIASGYEKPYKAFGVHKNGTKFPIRIEGREIMYKGRHTRVVEFNDITQEEKLNEELSILNTQLELKVQERTQKLEDSFKELEQTQKHLIETEKMASLGSLVAGIAHEINTPIGLSITSMTHFISQTQKLNKLHKNEDMSEEDFLKYMQDADKLAEVTYENLKRAAELVKSFKQISIDQTSEHSRDFNLKKYIEGVLLSLHNRIKQTQIQVEVNCPSELNINSYPGAFSQIFTNLIMNSLIHAYDIGEKGLISLNFELKDSNLLFTYKDDGKGIGQENLKHIFDPFFTTNRAHGGSGLGLNIIYNIITVQLKGSVMCQSEEEQGLTFTINIPLTKDLES
ncbi:MAG: PAS domain-containing sensor histidine kinase [Campylobacterota bacterium]|nr:PAS domain-containing sensor histidine kinase [Campylobacterota bacterium]